MESIPAKVLEECKQLVKVRGGGRARGRAGGVVGGWGGEQAGGATWLLTKLGVPQGNSIEGCKRASVRIVRGDGACGGGRGGSRALLGVHAG